MECARSAQRGREGGGERLRTVGKTKKGVVYVGERERAEEKDEVEKPRCMPVRDRREENERQRGEEKEEGDGSKEIEIERNFNAGPRG